MVFYNVFSKEPPKDIMKTLRQKLPQIEQNCQELRAKYVNGLFEREDDYDVESAAGHVDFIYRTYTDLVKVYSQIAQVNLPKDERLEKVRQLVANKDYAKLQSFYEQGGF
jgi:hypothetical protein